MSRAPRSRNRNGLPDSKRRAELQATAAERVKARRPTKIRLGFTESDALYQKLVSDSVDPTAVLAEAIAMNLDVLNGVMVSRNNRPNGSAKRLRPVNVRVHFVQAERFFLAANANGLSHTLAAEVLLRASLLGDPTIAY